MIRNFLPLLAVIVSFLFLPNESKAAGTPRKHLIYFKDKANTPYSVNQPEQFLSQRSMQRRKRQNLAVTHRDLPVNPAYVQGLKANGGQVWYTSRWFNAAVVLCDSTVLAQLQALPYVKNAQTLNRTGKPITEKNPKVTSPKTNTKEADRRALYGKSFNQAEMLGAIDMHEAGFRGEDMLVAVFDAGFPNVDKIPAFDHLFKNKQIKATFDFVNKDPKVYGSNSHGTLVLSTMAAYEPGKFIGTAYKAGYYLFITEDAATEHNIEEVNWLVAAEFADSAGVDVINSSLGYTTFDLPSRSYQYSDMNGGTTIITKAADFAAGTGMLVVTSAGNEGGTGWHFISAPADADSVLTVGAIDSVGNKAGFSSFGPTSDGRIKPNVVAQGGFAYVVGTSGDVHPANGTSFSSPIMAGLTAVFWQANPNLTNLQVIDALQKSATLANNPDFNVGYGIPNAKKAIDILLKSDPEFSIYPNPLESNKLTLQLNRNLLDKPLSFKIYDAVGKLVFEQEFTTSIPTRHITLNPQIIHTGMYYGVISGNNTSKTIRFLKI